MLLSIQLVKTRMQERTFARSPRKKIKQEAHRSLLMAACLEYIALSYNDAVRCSEDLYPNHPYSSGTPQFDELYTEEEISRNMACNPGSSSLFSNSERGAGSMYSVGEPPGSWQKPAECPVAAADNRVLDPACCVSR